MPWACRYARLAVEDKLDVALVWQRHRLSPAAAAFVAEAEGAGGDSRHASDTSPWTL
jgi:hypothetical protein